MSTSSSFLPRTSTAKIVSNSSWYNFRVLGQIERIEFVESEKLLGKGEGGKNEDDEYLDLLPNI